MLHLIRTLFSLTLVLAFTVAGYPIQNENTLLKNELKGLGKRFHSIRPQASAPRPWVKTARNFIQEAPREIHAEKRASRPIPRSPGRDVATSRQTTGWSNPRPWVRKDEVISSTK
ncbi:hypothetical protein, variant [Puccinia triticina 1-1 BBBD Race 1]|uniref:Uncharacterized protein n=2 Tax=Puccinia triticina TaxID=208348 RepID=A0A0C4F1W0_PUCT1|nr:uncharacterized protein PtA15_10A713 [Puccinia triticina]OAV88366.1 hypothetical protein PTTG_07081 [Puccinia triticina 1-1 BBBD Race 1]OAV88367.1 hypothetical protein, variant [Puccinia triticina 1-1 BBBD Race 1]WAQ89289.1 hypothetical protein PtA15_10A713 [Puccinia triticina]WAR59340.1 hypothetical protein PtB15_10B682 [Puccinia triticina]